MKHLKPVVTSAILVAAMSLPASAQTGRLPEAGRTGDPIVQVQPNTTGNDRDVVVSRGATGADTATSDSAAGGNASLPERAIPNGSAGGSSR